MNCSWIFFINSVLLGVGLAMDAFSVSMANGLNESAMKKKRMCLVAGVFAFFQFIMPLAGWFCVYTFLEYFSKFSKFIPWIALLLLLYIGGKMIFEAVHEEKAGSGNDSSGEDGGIKKADCISLSFATLLLQGIATSIDALSVGFTIADYRFHEALTASLIIAVVTFAICFAGLHLGKKAGNHLSEKADVLGGIILIGIGIEIFVKGVFF